MVILMILHRRIFPGYYGNYSVSSNIQCETLQFIDRHFTLLIQWRVFHQVGTKQNYRKFHKASKSAKIN